MEVFFITLIVLLLFLPVPVFVIIAGRKKKSGEAIQLEKLAGELGLPVLGGEPFLPRVPVLKFLKKPLFLEGEFRGRRFKVYHYTAGSGDSQTRYAAVRAGVSNPKGLVFQFSREGFFSKIGKTFGMRDIQVGDPVFDEKFVVKSNDPEFIAAALLAEMKEKFYKARELKARGVIKLDKDEIRYNEVGSIGSDETRRRFALIAGLLADLAEAAEVYNN